MTDRPNYITPAGFATLRQEYERLFAHERPALVETISWAAGNGDRSENGDYIYGRKRLREIDRRLGWLSRRMKAAKVVDPAQQQAPVVPGAEVIAPGGNIGGQHRKHIDAKGRHQPNVEPGAGFIGQRPSGQQDQPQPNGMHRHIGPSVARMGTGKGGGG